MEDLLILIVSSYLVPVLGLIFLLILTLINPLFQKNQNKFLLITIIINLGLIVITSLDAIFAQQRVGYMWIFRRLTSFINFAAGPIIPICWFRVFSEKRPRFAFYLPLIANAVLCFASMFTKLVFHISSENNYGRGVFIFVPLVTSFFYMAVIALRPSVEKKQSKKLEFYFLLTIIGVMITSTALEMVLGVMFLNWGCIAICLIMYYLIVNIHTYIVDPLTGAYNRLRYNRDVARLQHSTNCVVGLLDINDFKKLNDEQGHIAGDECLKKISEVLEESLGSGSKLYRIGGDEFVFISTKHNIEVCRAKLKFAQEKLTKSNISFSAGVLEYNMKYNIYNILKEADRLMYEDKKNYKKIGAAIINKNIKNAGCVAKG